MLCASIVLCPKKETEGRTITAIVAIKVALLVEALIVIAEVIVNPVRRTIWSAEVCGTKEGKHEIPASNTSSAINRKP